MESKTKNKKTREQIDRMVRRAYAGAGLVPGPDSAVELKEGWFNAVYELKLEDGREVVLKIAPPGGAEILTYETNIMETEVAAMRLVHENPAIPVPEIHFHDSAHDLCDSDYFFMEKLAGDNLEHVRETYPPETQAEIQMQIGKIVHAINGFTGTYFGYPGNHDLRADTWRAAFLTIMDAVLEDGGRKNVDYGHDTDVLSSVIHKHAPALDAVRTPQLVHWDAWNSNFFVKDGQITGLLDFERALWGDPLMEAQFRPVFGVAVTDSMQGYGKTDFSFEEQQRRWLYTLYLALVINTECYYRNYDNDQVYHFSKRLLDASLDWLRAA